MFDLGSFEWSELIAISALALSLWNAFARWNDKQPRVFLSNLFVETFVNQTMRNVYIRLDMDIAALSSEPIPLSRASVSMDKEQWYDCTSRFPKPDKLMHYGTHACNRNQNISDLFVQPIRFPATLSPSSAQHMTLWLHLPCNSGLHNSLMEALVLDPERSSVSASTQYRYRTLIRSLRRTDDSMPQPHLWVRLWVGNRIVLAETAIDKRCWIPLQP